MESHFSLSPSHPFEPDLVLRLGSSPSQLGSGGFSLMPSPPVLAEPEGAVAAPELPLGEFFLSRNRPLLLFFFFPQWTFLFILLTVVIALSGEITFARSMCIQVSARPQSRVEAHHLWECPRPCRHWCRYLQHPQLIGCSRLSAIAAAEE